MNPFLTTAVRTGQMIVAALLIGMLTFAGVATSVGPLKPGAGPGAGAAPAGPLGGIDPLLLTLGALVIMSVPVMVTVSIAMFRQATRLAASLAHDHDARDRALASVWISLTIVRAALAEGIGLFGAVIILLNGERIALGAVAFAAAVLLVVMPTRGRLESWIERSARAAALPPRAGGMR